jgi:teichuronic acid biosynthesis glycosyltransferase TuaC
LRVLLVTTSYPAGDADASGHFVRAEARRLARDGHEVHVIAPGPNSTHCDPVAPSVVVHQARGLSLFGWPGAIARAKTNPLRLVHALPFAVSVRKHIEVIGRVDRVIGHWVIPCGVPLLLDHPAPLEVVAHGADVRLLCRLPRPVRNAIVTTLVDRGTRFRFVASSLCQTLKKTLPPLLEERLARASYIEPAVIELPDVTTKANEIRASNQGELRGFVVAVGRFIELKRFELAVVSAASANVPIVLVGDGPLRGHLEHVARTRHVRATFTGLLSRVDTLAWIAASRALVHTSCTEGAPTVVREARALGVPVIATPSGDLAAWAQTDPGIVLVDSERDAIAAAIVAVVESLAISDQTPSHHEFR